MILPKSIICLAAAISGASAAADLPKWAQPAVDSGLALGGLNGLALLRSLGETEGSCNIFNIKYRQEWYVPTGLEIMCLMADSRRVLKANPLCVH